MNITEHSLDRNLTHNLATDLESFREFGAATRVEEKAYALGAGTQITLPTFTYEFWTSKQRQANSLHEVSYRACFKPQLPRFSIERHLNKAAQYSTSRQRPIA